MSLKDKIGGELLSCFFLKWVFLLLPMTCNSAFKTSKSPNKLFGDEYALCSQKTKSGGKWVFPVPLFPMTCKFAFKTSKSPNKLFGDEYALCPQKTKSGENEYSRSPYSQWHVNLHSKIQSPPIIYLGTNMRYVLKRQNRGEFMFFSLNEYSPYSQWHVILHSKLQSPPTNYLGTNMLYVPKRQNRGEMSIPGPPIPNDM